jgi:hypothetical protein
MYHSFNQALDAACDALADSGDERVDVAALTTQLFQQWLQQRRFDALIGYLHEQFEHGGGDALIDALSAALLAEGDLLRLQRLWTGVVAGRREQFRVSNRGVGSAASQAQEQVQATRMRPTLSALQRYQAVLQALGETSGALVVADDIQLFRSGRKRTLPPVDARPMDDSLFWQLIVDARRDALNPAHFLERLSAALARFKASAIKNFQVLLRQRLAQLYSWDLWALAYIARGGCSDDEFVDFRAWLVSQGPELFTAALDEPELLAERMQPDWDLQCEGLAYAALNAHVERQGREMRLAAFRPGLPRGESWQPEDLPLRYPHWWAHFVSA